MNKIKTMEDLISFEETLKEIEERIQEIGEGIGFLNRKNYLESFDFNSTNKEIQLVAGNVYDNDSERAYIPYSYLLDKNYLGDYLRKEEEKRAKESEIKKIKEDQKAREKEKFEKLEFERLKAKYENKN